MVTCGWVAGCSFEVPQEAWGVKQHGMGTQRTGSVVPPQTIHIMSCHAYKSASAAIGT